MFVANQQFRIMGYFLFCLLLTTSITTKAVNKSKSLTPVAGIFATFLGVFMLYFFPLIGFQLLAFFYLGKSVTQIGKDVKLKIEDQFTEQRDAFQVLSNSCLPLILCLIKFFNPNSDLKILYPCLASFSACLGDTFSSELGILMKSKTRLINKPWILVPKGTNGGVTLGGFLVAAVAGLILGALSFLQIQIITNLDLDIQGVGSDLSLSKHLMIASISGLFGSMLDSWLGAVFEYTGKNTKTGKITNQIKDSETVIQNFGILTGNQVNLITGVVIGCVTLCLRY